MADEEPVKIELTDEIDLHHFNPRDAKDILREFIAQAKEKGLVRVRVVHGKGRSVMKKIVAEELGKNEAVSSFSDDRANWGATIVVLK
jgi:DNA-nicking Smr family endonuclease